MANLTEQQKYLLNRLPTRYSLKSPAVTEPAEVKQARKVIATFDEKIQKQKEERDKKYLKSLASVREAIYFNLPEDALKMLRALEEQFSEVVK